MLLLVLAACAVLLFRKLMTLAEAVSRLGDRVDTALADGAEPVPSVNPDGGPGPLLPAVFQNPFTLAAHVEQQRAERLLRRQQRRDARIVRGKLLRNAPVTQKD